MYFCPSMPSELLETVTNAGESNNYCRAWIPQHCPNCKSSHSQAMRDSLLRHVLRLCSLRPGKTSHRSERIEKAGLLSPGRAAVVWTQDELYRA